MRSLMAAHRLSERRSLSRCASCASSTRRWPLSQAFGSLGFGDGSFDVLTLSLFSKYLFLADGPQHNVPLYEMVMTRIIICSNMLVHPPHFRYVMTYSWRPSSTEGLVSHGEDFGQDNTGLPFSSSMTGWTKIRSYVDVLIFSHQGI